MSATRVSTTSVHALQTRVRELDTEVSKLRKHLEDIQRWACRTEHLPIEQLQWRLQCIRTCLNDPDRE